MKKILALLLALLMIFALVACDESDTPNNTDPSGNTDNSGASQEEPKDDSGRKPSTDYFWEKYDFTEEWMLPDDGVYTSYKYVDPAENTAGNEAVQVTVYDITEDQIADYIKKVEEHGYTNLIGDSYSKSVDGKTAMIEVKNYLEDGYIIIVIDPSI